MKPAKKNIHHKVQEPSKNEISAPLFVKLDVKIQYGILAILALGFYFNSIFNDYAFDDGLVILENTFVQKGFDGIVDIFTHGELDAIYEKYKMKEQFSGGRYRPLSIATFAIEQAVFGPGAMMKHVFNVVYYLLTCILVLYFLRNYIFKRLPDVAFVAALLFTIHPIHSEVVANIKSRNELFPMLFTIITMISALRYFEKRNILWVFIGCFSLFLALISKEYGVVMAGLLPILFYIHQKTSVPKSILYALPSLIPIGLYLIIRYSVLPEVKYDNLTMEPTNNQYIMAGPGESFPTKLAVLDNYLFQLFIPAKLVCDYSYYQIKFLTFSDWKPWVSLFIHLLLLAWTIFLIFKKEITGFFLAFYLAHLFLISNLMVEIGTTYSERLIYMGSLAFCVVIAYYLIMLLRNPVILKFSPNIISMTLIMIVVLSGMKVIPRNSIWKNNETLFINDVEINSGSLILSNNAGKAYLDLSMLPENINMKEQLLNKCIKHLNYSINLYPKSADAFFNFGAAYMNLEKYDSAFIMYSRSREIRNNRPDFKAIVKFFKDKGMYYGSKKEYPSAVQFLEYASKLDKTNAEILGNLGGAYYMNGQVELAKEAWENALKIDSTQKDALKGYQIVKALKEK